MKTKKRMKRMMKEVVAEIRDLDARMSDIEHNVGTHLVHDHGYIDTGEALVKPTEAVQFLPKEA